MIVLNYKTPYGEFRTYNEKPEINFLEVNQTHSNIVIESDQINQSTEADGIVAKQDEILAIKTADCLPVFLFGENRYAFIHAGWKGLESKILSQITNWFIPEYAFIGPHIAQDNYEVGNEFKAIFHESTLNEKNGSLYFSLQKAAVKELSNINKEINIEFSDLDTYTQESLRSFRRDKTKQRNWNLFIPNL